MRLRSWTGLTRNRVLKAVVAFEVADPGYDVLPQFNASIYHSQTCNILADKLCYTAFKAPVN